LPDVIAISGAELSGEGAAADVVVTGLTLSSQAVRPGDLFVAPPGSAFHGARFAADAVRSGAVAVLTDPAGAGLCADLDIDVPVLVVPAPRQVLGAVSARVYDEPARGLRLFAVTGTRARPPRPGSPTRRCGRPARPPLWSAPSAPRSEGSTSPRR
jgi:UDP-N-acetylmuramoyl-L-alanyl-D-glutamate--2,6-diaminopimelate ligase